jgi:hypothetical protein
MWLIDFYSVILMLLVFGWFFLYSALFNPRFNKLYPVFSKTVIAFSFFLNGIGVTLGGIALLENPPIYEYFPEPDLGLISSDLLSQETPKIIPLDNTHTGAPTSNPNIEIPDSQIPWGIKVALFLMTIGSAIIFYWLCNICS